MIILSEQIVVVFSDQHIDIPVCSNDKVEEFCLDIEKVCCLLFDES
jgi:hypothetical protein